ncbi:MAG: apolipoprotein N-acyltransferase [Actinomycetota bacterium]
MRSFLMAVVAAALLVLAFPPFGWGFLVMPAITVLLWELRRGPRPLLTGTVFGLGFYTSLIWWVGKLGLIAVTPLVVVFSLYLAGFGWLLGKARRWDGSRWFWAATGGWALMEATRVRFPFGGFEWGLLGYPMGEYPWTRWAAQFVGTSGWGVLITAMAAGTVISAEERRLDRRLALVLIAFVVCTLAAPIDPPIADGPPIRVAIVQGSTPCPLTHCLHERRLTYEMHLNLTRTISPGSVDLVVWPEGSTGGFDADPVLVAEVRQALGAEAARIGAYLLVGGDRPISDEHWINANVVVAPDGNIFGEYRKRHPVPFGEYIPARPLFDWIPALDQVPRDMIPGEEAVVFDLPVGRVGSVISFEAAFARYGRDEARSGAQILVVATNEGSYEFTPVSDQFLGMTRMRSAELGLDVVHSAVTGKSAFISDGGEIGPPVDFLDERVITSTLHLSDGSSTLYTLLGEWVQALALIGLVRAIGLPRIRQKWPRV